MALTLKYINASARDYQPIQTLQLFNKPDSELENAALIVSCRVERDEPSRGDFVETVFEKTGRLISEYLPFEDVLTWAFLSTSDCCTSPPTKDSLNHM